MLKRKGLFILFLMVAAIEGAYVIGTNYFLRDVLRSQIVNLHPEKIQMQYESARTYFPGLVHLKKFSLGGQDGSVAWHVELDEAWVVVNLPPLIWRTLSVQSVKSNGGLFRLQLHLPKLKKESPKDSGAVKSEGRGPFRFHISGIHLENFRELRIHDYAYLGSTEIGGEFFLWPGRELQVVDGNVNLKNGEVNLTDKKLALALDGRIHGSIRDWFPKVHSAAEVFDKTSAQIDLEGSLAGADFINHYLKSVPWVKFGGVAGTFAAHVTVDKGSLIEPTTAWIDAKHMGARLGQYLGQGSGKIEWKMDKGLRMSTRLNSYQFLDRDGASVIMKGPYFNVEAVALDTRLRKAFSSLSDLSVQLDFPKAEVTDLRFINVFIPMGDTFKILGGNAQLSAKINVSSHHTAAPGFFQLETRNAGARFDNSKFQGDLLFRAEVEDVDAGTNNFKVSGSHFDLKNVRVENLKKASAKEELWAGRMILNEGHLRPYNRVVFEGSTALQLDNARPILALLSSQSRMARVLGQVAKMNHIEGRADFRLGPRLLDLANVSFKSSDLNIEGRFRYFEEKRKFIALVKYRIFEVAVEVDGKKSDTHFNRARAWFLKRPAWPSLVDGVRSQ